MEESEGQWRMGCAQNVVKGEGEAERLFFFFGGGGEWSSLGRAKEKP